jgi:hypothetical protein
MHTPTSRKEDNADVDHRQFLESLRSRLNVDEATIDQLERRISGTDDLKK